MITFVAIIMLSFHCTSDIDCIDGHISKYNVWANNTCRFDSDCMENSYCVSGICKTECIIDNHCKEQYYCLNNKCILRSESKHSTATPCIKNNDCKYGHHCLSFICTNNRCMSDKDCGMGEYCNSYKCMLKACTYDGKCSGGITVIQGISLGIIVLVMLIVVLTINAYQMNVLA